MPPDEDESPTRWPWLDWWFAPRWRALVTWVALAGLTRWASYYHWKQVEALYHWPIDLMNRFLPTPLPGFVDTIALCVNLGVLSSWFQPLALRLNLWRAGAWVGVGIAIGLIANFAISNPADPWPDAGLSLLSSGALAFVLRGWRNRPWMVFVAGAPTFAVWKMASASLRMTMWRSPVLSDCAAALIYAAILLYGTRLLTPEERARRRNVAWMSSSNA